MQPPTRPNKTRAFIKIHREITERAPTSSQLSEYIGSQVNTSLDRSLIMSKHVSKNSNQIEMPAGSNIEYIPESESLN